MAHAVDQSTDGEWITFPGGELEGKRPKALCPSCRARLETAAGAPHPLRRRTLCFQCYRADLDRGRALAAAGHLNTASDERFQSTLPFEPVDRPRLAMLKVERIAERSATGQGIGMFVDRRRHAQIAARHALQQIAATAAARLRSAKERELTIARAIHAAELQLPESWLPFVVSR
jgi:hypothetical protein